MRLFKGRSYKGIKGIKLNDKDKKIFYNGIESLYIELAKYIIRDGEGATKLIEINVLNARNEKDANTFAKSIANSPLVKTAIQMPHFYIHLEDLFVHSLLIQ